MHISERTSTLATPCLYNSRTLQLSADRTGFWQGVAGIAAYFATPANLRARRFSAGLLEIELLTLQGLELLGLDRPSKRPLASWRSRSAPWSFQRAPDRDHLRLPWTWPSPASLRPSRR